MQNKFFSLYLQSRNASFGCRKGRLKASFADGETYCGNSSVGRAQPCQGWGREFESRFPLRESATYRNEVADFLFTCGGKEAKAPFQGPGSHCLSIKLPIGNVFSLLRQTMRNNDFRTNTPARTRSISPRYVPCVPGTNAGNQ